LSWDVALPVVEAGPPEGRRAFREWMEREVGRRVEEEIRGLEEFAAEMKDKIPAEYLRDFYELRFAVGYLDDRLVSILMCEYHGAKWAAHPFWSAWVVNFRLDEGRPLEVAEMFRGSPEAAWLKYCACRIAKQIEDLIYGEATEDAETEEEKAVCADTEREREVTDDLRLYRRDWGQVLLTADGPIFVFNGFSHAVGEVHGCLVPWRKAVRLLRPEFRHLVGLPRARGAGLTVGTQGCVLPTFFEDVKVGGRRGSEVERWVRAERRKGERSGLSWDVALPVVEVGPPEGQRAFREWMEREVSRRVEEEIRGFEEFVAEKKDKIPAEDLRASYELRYTVGHLDDRLVSILMCEYHDDPVGRREVHPVGSAWVVNFRLDEGRPLEVAEMFRGSPEEVWPDVWPEVWLKDCVRRDRRYRERAVGRLLYWLDCSECFDLLSDEEYGRQDWDRVLLTTKGLAFICDTRRTSVHGTYGDYLVCLIPWGSARQLLRPEFRRLVGLR
jgi:hypothetical protein